MAQNHNITDIEQPKNIDEEEDIIDDNSSDGEHENVEPLGNSVLLTKPLNQNDLKKIFDLQNSMKKFINDHKNSFMASKGTYNPAIRTFCGSNNPGENVNNCKKRKYLQRI